MQNFNDEISHHGIKGQRWGLRRYQNKDGSLTPAGRKRVAKMKDEYTQLTGKRLIRKPSPKAAEPASQNTKKKVKDLTDTELNDRINRLQKEKQLIGLQNELAPKGQKFVSAVGKQVIVPAAAEAGKELLKNKLIQIGKAKLGLNPKKAEGIDAIYEELKKEKEILGFKKAKYKLEEEIKEYEAKRSTEKAKQKEEASKKPENVEAEFVKAKKVKNDKKTSYKKEEPTIIDAEFTDMSPDSTAIVPYVQRGESYVDRLFKDQRR